MVVALSFDVIEANQIKSLNDDASATLVIGSYFNNISLVNQHLNKNNTKSQLEF